jgi:hypothetical protein
MNDTLLPKLDRRVPRLGMIFVSLMYYLVAVPLHWLFTKLGFRSALVTMMIRGPGGGKFEKVFQSYRPTEHDVFVSTFAKSGTNWMMQIAHQVSFRGAGDYAHIHDVVCWPDMRGKRSRRMAISLDDTLVQQASPSKLRVIKTHLSALNIPYDEKARYLVVVRDPKEVFVSSYYFAGGAAGRIMPTQDVWFSLFLTDKFPLNFGNTWAEHTASYWALKDKPNVLVLSFKKMKQDLPGAVRQVADVLGVNLTSAELDRVVEKSSFSYMSRIDDKFSPMPKGTLPWSEGFRMMRQGKDGNSKEMLTLAQQMRIDAHFQNELKELGSDFPYAEFCYLADETEKEGAA